MPWSQSSLPWFDPIVATQRLLYFNSTPKSPVCIYICQQCVTSFLPQRKQAGARVDLTSLIDVPFSPDYLFDSLVTLFQLERLPFHSFYHHTVIHLAPYFLAIFSLPSSAAGWAVATATDDDYVVTSFRFPISPQLIKRTSVVTYGRNSPCLYSNIIMFQTN
jgi:hypothetical protein